MEESRKQLEKESNIMWEEATKYLSSTKSDVESKRSATETRQKNVEAVLSEVAFLKVHDISIICGEWINCYFLSAIDRWMP